VLCRSVSIILTILLPAPLPIANCVIQEKTVPGAGDDLKTSVHVNFYSCVCDCVSYFVCVVVVDNETMFEDSSVSFEKKNMVSSHHPH
jgi:hypothetical protein